jgi:hypothetical protein
VPVHRPRAARSACAAHTRSSSFTHPILSEVARSTHQQSTPRGQLHLAFQREPAVTSPVRIKSQSYWFESNRGSRAPAQRPVGLLPAINCREDASQTHHLRPCGVVPTSLPSGVGRGQRVRRKVSEAARPASRAAGPHEVLAAPGQEDQRLCWRAAAVRGLAVPRPR